MNDQYEAFSKERDIERNKLTQLDDTTLIMLALSKIMDKAVNKTIRIFDNHAENMAIQEELAERATKNLTGS